MQALLTKNLLSKRNTESPFIMFLKYLNILNVKYILNSVYYFIIYNITNAIYNNVSYTYLRFKIPVLIKDTGL